MVSIKFEDGGDVVVPGIAQFINPSIKPADDSLVDAFRVEAFCKSDVDFGIAFKRACENTALDLSSDSRLEEFAIPIRKGE